MQFQGGKSLDYIVTEVVRFMQTNHKEISLRCDCEPATLAILDSVKETCRNLGIFIHHEPTPVGDHQANGAAEATMKLIRAQANVLVSAIEKECCEGRIIFGCNHPVYAWAVLHACWIHNRFSVANGSTPLELCSGRMYTGKLARYGERVLGFLKTDMKGKPQWRPGIWLGKTTQNDTRIIAVADGVFVTRSIRRLTSAFDVKYFTDLTRCAWECNYAALGHTMMHAKRVLAPVPVPSMIDANLAPPPMLTASVPYTPDEAAFDPPTPSETKSSPAPTTPGVVTSPPSPIVIRSRKMLPRRGRFRQKQTMKKDQMNQLPHHFGVVHLRQHRRWMRARGLSMRALQRRIRQEHPNNCE